MSDSNTDFTQNIGSGIFPTERFGLFRCGICWSSAVEVRGQIEDGKVIVYLVCPVCGNRTETQIAIPLEDMEV